MTIETLSPRERQISQMVSEGLRNKEIAGRLFISEQTVKNHMHNIFGKTGVTDRLELALLAISLRHAPKQEEPPIPVLVWRGVAK